MIDSGALFGLLGVIVGGLITAGTTWLNARFERQRQTRSAAWLVRNELADVLAALEYARKYAGWWPEGALVTQCWADHRAILTEVRKETWDEVADAYARLEDAERERKRKPDDIPDEAAIDNAIALVNAAASSLETASVFRSSWHRRLASRLRRTRGAATSSS